LLERYQRLGVEVFLRRELVGLLLRLGLSCVTYSDSIAGFEGDRNRRRHHSRFLKINSRHKLPLDFLFRRISMVSLPEKFATRTV
jgi:hypothetical protein